MDVVPAAVVALDATHRTPAVGLGVVVSWVAAPSYAKICPATPAAAHVAVPAIESTPTDTENGSVHPAADHTKSIPSYLRNWFAAAGTNQVGMSPLGAVPVTVNTAGDEAAAALYAGVPVALLKYSAWDDEVPCVRLSSSGYPT